MTIHQKVKYLYYGKPSVDRYLKQDIYIRIYGELHRKRTNRHTGNNYILVPRLGSLGTRLHAIKRLHHKSAAIP